MAFLPTAWSAADKGSAVTLSNADLTTSYSAYTGSNVRAAAGKSSGKWYWELTIAARHGSAYINAGVWPASRAIGTYIYNTSGVYRIIPTVHAVGDVFGFAFDAGSGTLAITRNGAALSTLTGLSITEPWRPVVGDDNAAGLVYITANFGATAFAYSVPSGFNPGIGEISYTLSGGVEDAAGVSAARLVRAYREDTGALAGSATSNGATGLYSIATTHTGAHTLVFYPAGADAGLGAIVLRGVTPV